MLEIYTWDGENLKLRWGEPSEGTRQTGFATTPEGVFLVVVEPTGVDLPLEK